MLKIAARVTLGVTLLWLSFSVHEDAR